MDLTDQHLFAEWREIKHVPAALKRRLINHDVSSTLKAIPAFFTLNTGHVTFFYDKMAFLSARYDALTEELQKRAYSLNTEDCSGFSKWLDGIPQEFKQKAYTPCNEAVQISRDRIDLRISEKPSFYRYYGKPLEGL